MAPKIPDQPVDKQKLVELIQSSVDAVSEENGWAHLGTVGSNISKLMPNFDPRLFGHKKFSGLVKSLPDVFDVKEESPDGVVAKSIYIRKKS